MDRNAQEELKAHLMQTDEDFRHLVEQHSDYAHKLEDLAVETASDRSGTDRGSPAEEVETSREGSDRGATEPLSGSERGLTSGALKQN